MTGPRLPLAVTMGDPAGIGPDIALLAWTRRHDAGLPAFTIFADPEALAARAKQLGLAVPILRITAPSEAHDAFATALPVMPQPLAAPVVPRVPNAANAPAVIASIERATAAVVAGQASALVTNPIAKSVLYATGFQHPGHTEFLAHLAGRNHPGLAIRPVMMIASDALRVVPLTVHMPLAAVPGAIRRDDIVATARIMHAALIRDFATAAPRIAVAGLNPHAGEDGTIGGEDAREIAPAVAELRAIGIDAIGPRSADTLFHPAARATYDAVLAMYHDQALIPAKTLAFDEGVNVTLGLPFVRTSPDHGTAFSIAGTGAARPTSFIAALQLAERMARRRAASTSA